MELTIDSTFVDSEELLSEIKSKFESLDNEELNSLREENHTLYYDIDVIFLNTVDKKYRKEATDILDKYRSIDPLKILNSDLLDSKKYNELLKEIDEDVKKLREIIKKDLLSIINYIDRWFLNIDISNVTRSTHLGILILNKYEALKIYSSNIDIKDINNTMKRQSKRLIYMQELNELIFEYNNSNTIYNKENTANLLNNLYIIVGDYLHLLTTVEYQYTKEAIKKILSYKFDFIDKYMDTYKIIMTKIWTSNHTEDFYFIRSLNLDDKNIYLINNSNINSYDDTGYVCDIPKYFISYFNMDNLDIISFPLPNNIKGKYKINIDSKDVDNVKLKAIYTTKDNVEDNILPVIYLNKK